MKPIFEHIQEFREKMVAMGYVEGEVNAFLHDQIEDRKVSDLSEEEAKELIEYMNDYLSFASKSRQLINN